MLLIALVISGPLSTDRLVRFHNYVMNIWGAWDKLTERRSQKEICERNILNEGVSHHHLSFERIHTMGNMIMTDIVKEKPAYPSQQWPINGSCCPTKERPGWFAVVGDRRV